MFSFSLGTDCIVFILSYFIMGGDYCCVPLCSNTSRNSKKLFFTVPRNSKRRKQWFLAMGRDWKDLSTKSILSVCEDHFLLQDDLENYIRFKYYPDSKHKVLKRDVVPHLFACQPDRFRPEKYHNIVMKRRRKEMSEVMIEDIDDISATESDSTEYSFDEAMTADSQIDVSPPPSPDDSHDIAVHEAALVLCNLSKSGARNIWRDCDLDDTFSLPHNWHSSSSISKQSIEYFLHFLVNL